VERFAQGEGYIQVGPEGVLVLVEEAVSPDQLDTSDLQERVRTAEEAAERAEDGTEEQRRAQRDRKRWQAFLDIAGG
jgi:F-type H+-transporting ATPase subunit epsilon